MNPDKKSTFEKDYAGFQSAAGLPDDSTNASANINGAEYSEYLKLQVWRRYELRLYAMKDISEKAVDMVPKVDKAVDIFRQCYIELVPILKNDNIPGADSIAIDNMPLEGQIVLDVYRDKLVDIGVEFEKQNRFINVIGAKRLTGRDPETGKIDDLIGFSNNFTVQDNSFHSILLASLYIFINKISKDKTLIHELGHCFGLKHGDYHSINCFMQQGNVDNPAFCDRCMKMIKNSTIFANE